jgi:hypothetical protein
MNSPPSATSAGFLLDVLKSHRDGTTRLDMVQVSTKLSHAQLEYPY